MIKVGSDFSGIGAFKQALLRLGIPHKQVFACDKDVHARKSYSANYGEPDYYPHDVNDRTIPQNPLDVYMTSPPCQAFSIAGKRGGIGRPDKTIKVVNGPSGIFNVPPILFRHVVGVYTRMWPGTL